MPIYSVEAARLWISANIRTRRRAPTGDDQNLGADSPAPTGPGGGEYWKAKIRREIAEAAKAELELAELEGDLIRKAKTEQAARNIASALVQQLSSIPARISSEFGTDDAHRRTIKHRLQEELDKVRAELARAGLMAEQ